MTALDPLALPLSGTTLIEASAGTGKTYTLATLYLRLLLEERLEVGQILVVTYTNAATAELRDRIRRRLREALAVFAHVEREGVPPPGGAAGRAPLVALAEASRRAGTLARDRQHLTSALRGFDEAAIFTIHGFCQRILLENAFESRVAFDAELVTEDGPLCAEVVQDYWLAKLHDAPATLVRHAYRERLVPEELERLARRVLTHRDMAVLPAPAPGPASEDLERLLAEERAALADAAAIWRVSGVAIPALLDPTQLNKNSYPPGSIAGWCDELAAWLERSAGGASGRCDKLVKFTARNLAARTKSGHRTPQHAFFAACDRLHAAQQAIDAFCAAHAVALQRELVDFARGEVARRHEAAGTQSFDDLLYRLRDALRAETGDLLARQVRERFRAALIDEFQDTDPVQYEIFHALYGSSGRPLFLIGDPKQAIYGFRGADVFTYVAAKAGARGHTLDTNHRSAPELVRAVNALFRRARDPFVFPDIPFHEVEPAPAPAKPLGGPLAGTPPLELLVVRREGAAGKKPRKDPYTRHVPGVVANEIVRLLESGTTVGERPLHAGDVAVLCRANWQAVAMQEELRRRGVPSVLQGDDSVFESAEAEEIERALRAIAEPGEPKLVRAALATRLLGLDADALVALQGDEAEWDRWAARFRSWLDVWTDHGFMAAFRRLLHACDTQRRLLALEDGERRLTNVLHVAELLQTAAREAHRGPLAVVDWLALMRSDARARVEMAKEAAQIRLESDERAVQLVTIHRSKGLEYGVVFCPFTWSGADLHPSERRWVKFHDPDDGLALKLDLCAGKDGPHVRRAKLEDFAENLRLLYVAVTRAKHRCTLVWARTSAAEHAPLGYLLHQADGATAEDRVAATKERVKQLAEADMLADLRRLEDESGGTIGVRDVVIPAAAAPLVWTPPDAVPAPLAGPLAPSRTLDGSWRTSSFSRLAASGGRTSHQAEEGVDRDEETAGRDGTASEPRTARAGEPVALHDLRAGARTGELLHWILEHVDFTRPDRAELPARVREGVARFAGDAASEPAIVRGLENALATPLGGDAGPLTLGALPRARRLDELPFLLPVRRPLDRFALAACFERHPSPVRPADYPARIRRLGFPSLAGFLNGFVDLVFEHAGRWYVVDYKSNLLGPRPEDYGPSALERAMSLHHYYLQYHLYVVAVHRHLSSRVPGYDYERAFGGVYYLFLRGMAPSHDAPWGVFHDRPSAALIDDISALLDTAAAGRSA